MTIARTSITGGSDVDASQALVALGPTIPVDVGFDPNFSPGIAGAEPAVKAVPALIDTGATLSCIDNKLAEELDLPLMDRQEFLAGIDGVALTNLYLAQIAIPQLNFVHYGRFAGVKLAEGQQIHKILLGRSFLRTFIMIYDGLHGDVRLAV